MVREVPSEEMVVTQDLNDEEESLTSSPTFSAQAVSVDMLKVTHVGAVKCRLSRLMSRLTQGVLLSF